VPKRNLFCDAILSVLNIFGVHLTKLCESVKNMGICQRGNYV